MDEPDPQRGRGVEALAGDEVPSAALSPILRSANGEITAGMIPSFTSENANTARSWATAMSAHATRPAPPPSAWPWTAATTGAGQVSIASSIRRSAFASATFAS